MYATLSLFVLAYKRAEIADNRHDPKISNVKKYGVLKYQKLSQFHPRAERLSLPLAVAQA